MTTKDAEVRKLANEVSMSSGYENRVGRWVSDQGKQELTP